MKTPRSSGDAGFDLGLTAKTPPVTAVPGEFRLLQKYLDERFADTIVLRFNEIEDLIGFALPAEARADDAWWATAAANAPQSPQSWAWVRASRSAVANMTAQTVMFERLPA